MKERIEAYEEKSEPLLEAIITGCRWGTTEQASNWTDALGRIVNANKKLNGIFYDALLNLSNYPALILMYGAGMASISGQNYHTLAAVLTDPIYRVQFRTDYSPLALNVYTWSVLDSTVANQVLGIERLYVPLSERLYKNLRQPMQALVRDDSRYDEIFDRFEFLMATVHADLADRAYIEQHGQPKSSGRRFWGPVGRFGYRGRYSNGSVVTTMLKEAERAGNQWPPLQAGLFGGSAERFVEVSEGIAELINQIGWH